MCTSGRKDIIIPSIQMAKRGSKKRSELIPQCHTARKHKVKVGIESFGL